MGRTRAKEYVRLNSFELGQVIGALGDTIERLHPNLQRKLKVARAIIYLDSGMSKIHVFGDQRKAENKELAIAVLKSPRGRKYGNR